MDRSADSAAPDPRPEHRIIASSVELRGLAVQLQADYEPRFAAANRDVSIGRVRSALSRGIGVELDGDWHSFHTARFSMSKLRWVGVQSVSGAEKAIRGFLDGELLLRDRDGLRGD
jgi:hypothetical protein